MGEFGLKSLQGEAAEESSVELRTAGESAGAVVVALVTGELRHPSRLSPLCSRSKTPGEGVSAEFPLESLERDSCEVDIACL